MKYTRFRDIPQYVSSGVWECNFAPESLLRFIREEQAQGLQIDPDFQRGHVWTEAQQIAFMEYFLSGGRSGLVIYLNNPDWNHRGKKDPKYTDYVLVDGKQRIEAVRRFVENEIPVYGSLYSEYTDHIRAMSFTFKVNVNDLTCKADVLRWYVQMNAGGTPHSAEEIARVKALLAQEQEPA